MNEEIIQQSQFSSNQSHHQGKLILKNICKQVFLSLNERKMETGTKIISLCIFFQPVFGGTSVIFLSRPDYSSFNSFDACAIESALNPVPFLKEDDRTTAPNSRRVYLYVWASSVDSQNTWIHLVSKIQGITVLYLDLVKVRFGI